MMMRFAPLLLIALTAACGDVTYPTAPSREVPSFYTPSTEPPAFIDLSGPPTPPVLPATVPDLSGRWYGAISWSDLAGVRSAVRIGLEATVQQQGRAIALTWRSVTSSDTGSVEGAVEGLGADARLVGTLIWDAPSNVPGFRCRVRGALGGVAWPAHVEWHAPTIVLENCTGSVAQVRFTLAR